MRLMTLLAVAAVSFSDYPGALSRKSPVEAVIDRGLVVEIVVRCGAGAGILTYSKADRRFCDSSLRCHSGLKAAREATCAGN